MSRESAQADEVADRTAARVAVLVAAWQAGQIQTPDLPPAVAVAVYSGKVIASRLADVLVSTWAVLPPLGVWPSGEHLDRLTKAAETVLETPEDAPQRFERLALSETLNSHRASLHACIRDHGFKHWERVVEEDACEVCEPLRGEVQPVSVGFRDHPGCRCSLRPYGEPVQPEETPRQEEPGGLITMNRTVTYA